MRPNSELAGIGCAAVEDEGDGAGGAGTPGESESEVDWRALVDAEEHSMD